MIAGGLRGGPKVLVLRDKKFGRPGGMILRGQWSQDGACEATIGIYSLEPIDFCRIIAAIRFDPSGGRSSRA